VWPVQGLWGARARVGRPTLGDRLRALKRGETVLVDEEPVLGTGHGHGCGAKLAASLGMVIARMERRAFVGELGHEIKYSKPIDHTLEREKNHHTPPIVNCSRSDVNATGSGVVADGGGEDGRSHNQNTLRGCDWAESCRVCLLSSLARAPTPVGHIHGSPLSDPTIRHPDHKLKNN